MDRMDRMDRIDRMDRMDRGRDGDRYGDRYGRRDRDMDRPRSGRSRHYDEEEEEMPRMAEEDHHIGKTREVTFTETGGLGLHISREWGHSHFLVIKRAGRPVTVTVGEHRPDGMFGRHREL